MASRVAVFAPAVMWCCLFLSLDARQTRQPVRSVLRSLIDNTNLADDRSTLKLNNRSAQETFAARAGARGVSDKWLLVFKPSAHTEKLQQLCLEAENATQGRFNGTCGRLHTGSLVQAVSGTFKADDVHQIKQAFKDELAFMEQDSIIQVGQYMPATPLSVQALFSNPVPLPSSATSSSGNTSNDSAASSTATAAAAGYSGVQISSLGSATPPWGLDMIDQRSLPLDHLYHCNALGTGVHVYHLDTGIRFTHTEFGYLDGSPGSRARPGFSVFGDDNATDCYGHGTHTAAIIGGLTFGVAKNVSLVAVRTLDCDGQAAYSQFITALQWVADNAEYPAIVTASISGPYSAALDQAVQTLIEVHGIPVVVSAGNDNADACTFSPSSSLGAIAVGAVDSKMRRWFASNWGSCVALHAPGVSVPSASFDSDTASSIMTGTSMATPYVTGTAALYMEQNQGASPGDVKAQLVASATAGAIRDDPAKAGSLNGTVTSSLNISSTPNLLLYSMLQDQAVLTPPILVTSSCLEPMAFTLSLTTAPNQAVQVSITAPAASWNPSQALAAISPSTFLFTGANWSSPQGISISPADISVGDWFVNVSFTSSDSFYDGYYQTVRVENNKTLTGESAADPRLIPSLPFSVTDSLALFADNLTAPCLTQSASSGVEVIYAYTPMTSIYVDISTCNSSFQPNLYAFTDANNGQSYSCSTTNVTCANNLPIQESAGMQNVRLLGGMTYFIAVEALDDMSGQYTLLLAESSALQSS